MGVNVKIRKRTLNFTEEKKQIYVAEADRGDVIDAKKIAQLIAQDTGARPAQVEMILNSLTNSMITWLEEGHGVKLGNFGSFMPSVKSASNEDPDKVGVKRLKLTFYPSKALWKRVNEVSYSTENLLNSEDSSSDGGDTPEEEGGSTEME